MKLLVYIYYIYTHVLLIFTFLTIFFFTYVKTVEAAQFKIHLESLVDKILNDAIKSNILNNTIFPKPKILPDNISKGIILKTLLDGVEEEIKENSKALIVKTKNKNNSILKRSIILLVIMIIIFIIFSIILIALKAPITRNHFKNAIIGLAAVAVTEFTFLNTVAKNYDAADPNYIRRKISNIIIKWIDTNISPLSSQK